MSNNKEIELEIKTHYGQERIYALTFTEQLQKLTGQKTISREHIEALKTMGFEFKIKAPEL